MQQQLVTNDNASRMSDHDYLLSTEISRELYHQTASTLPVVDFHNHLDPSSFHTGNKPKNITQLWVSCDPYKHRAMRLNGIPEVFITGDADDDAKFAAWAKTVPKTIGGPLFDWSMMELARGFGITDKLDEKNAREIQSRCNQQFIDDGFSSIAFLKQCHVQCLCPCAQVQDDLSDFHAVNDIAIIPSLRGDSILNVPQLVDYFKRQQGVRIRTLDDYKAEVVKRINEFDQAGCLVADHSLDDGFVFTFDPAGNLDQLFTRCMAGDFLTFGQEKILQTELMRFASEQYAKRNWALQFHMGAQRHTNSRLRSICGPTGGFAAAGESMPIASLSRFMDHLNNDDSLPRMILYTLNPAHMQALAILTGSYSQDGTPGKIQLGPAWWFNDHFSGITQHLDVLANYALLARFIGMTTDSRSVLSFSRHEYFRRILCRTLGDWVNSGRIPDERALLHELVADICVNNIRHYLGIGDSYGGAS